VRGGDVVTVALAAARRQALAEVRLTIELSTSLGGGGAVVDRGRLVEVWTGDGHRRPTVDDRIAGRPPSRHEVAAITGWLGAHAGAVRVLEASGPFAWPLAPDRELLTAVVRGRVVVA
jgi:hypothetical protein